MYINRLYTRRSEEVINMSEVKEYPSYLWDNMQRFMADYNDHMVHFVAKFDKTLDIESFKLALSRAIDIAPILKCRFVIKFSNPVWREIPGFRIDDVFELVEGDDSWETIEKFLVGIIDEEKEAQVKFKVYRKDGKDTFAMLINHMTFDGQAIKEWLGIVAKLYTNILTDKNYNITDYENGDRSFEQLFQALPVKDRIKASTMFSYGKKNSDKIGFPYSKKNRYGLTPKIMKYKLPAEDFIKIKTVAKRNDMTLNDMIMSVWSRSVADLIPMEKVPLQIDCILDLRRYMPDKRTKGLTNFVTKIVCDVDNYKSESIFSTIAQVNQNMEAAKGDYPGLGGLPQLRFGYKVLPHKMARAVVRKAFNNPLVAISNIGILDEKTLTFGDLYLEDAFMTGSIKKAPYIQLALTTLRNEITFTIALYANDEDIETTKKCFAHMQKYFDIIKNA